MSVTAGSQRVPVPSLKLKPEEEEFAARREAGQRRQERLALGICAPRSPLPKRWMGERTFGWLNRHRSLSLDYERKESSSETFIQLGMIDLMLRRLA